MSIKSMSSLCSAILSGMPPYPADIVGSLRLALFLCGMGVEEQKRLQLSMLPPIC
jgi:hypothetical protein